MDSVDDISPGDYRNIDKYLQELENAGYQADYQNIWNGVNGFTAVLRVENQEHAVFEATPTGHLVKEIRTPLHTC